MRQIDIHLRIVRMLRIHLRLFMYKKFRALCYGQQVTGLNVNQIDPSFCSLSSCSSGLSVGSEMLSQEIGNINEKSALSVKEMNSQ